MAIAPLDRWSKTRHERWQGEAPLQHPSAVAAHLQHPAEGFTRPSQTCPIMYSSKKVRVMAEVSKKKKEVAEYRPAFADLFAHRIADELAKPFSTSTHHYPEWVSDHRNKKRFYVKGWAEVQRMTGQTLNRPYFAFAGKALIEARRSDDWRRYTVNIGPESFAEQQVGLVARGMPVTFDRAGLIILAAELLYREQAIADGKRPDLVEFYRKVSILPACYNIDKFNRERWEGLLKAHPGLAAMILADIQASDETLLHEMARGFCVTFKTAMAVKAAISKHTGTELGLVRPHPGNKSLGKERATELERPALNEQDSPMGDAIEAGGH